MILSVWQSTSFTRACCNAFRNSISVVLLSKHWDFAHNSLGTYSHKNMMYPNSYCFLQIALFNAWYVHAITLLFWNNSGIWIEFYSVSSSYTIRPNKQQLFLDFWQYKTLKLCRAIEIKPNTYWSVSWYTIHFSSSTEVTQYKTLQVDETFSTPVCIHYI